MSIRVRVTPNVTTGPILALILGALGLAIFLAKMLLIGAFFVAAGIIGGIVTLVSDWHERHERYTGTHVNPSRRHVGVHQRSPLRGKHMKTVTKIALGVLGVASCLGGAAGLGHLAGAVQRPASAEVVSWHPSPGPSQVQALPLTLDEGRIACHSEASIFAQANADRTVAAFPNQHITVEILWVQEGDASYASGGTAVVTVPETIHYLVSGEISEVPTLLNMSCTATRVGDQVHAEVQPL